MDVLFIVGRVLFALIFVGSGFGHLRGYAQMRPYAESKGVPAAGAAVIVSGIWIILCALGVVLGVWADLASLGLVVFLVLTAVVMHGFWRETDPMQRMMEMIQFQKDLGLAGAALVFFAALASGADLGPMVTAPVFGS